MLYGYIENGALIADDIQPVKREYVDADGNRLYREVSIEEQIQERDSDLWKPVDDLDEDLANWVADGYCTRVIPVDAGDHISFTYKRVPDRFMYVSTISKLKEDLDSSDYKIIKCYEASLIGEPMPYDVRAIHTERQALRDRINELETRFLAMQESAE